MPLEKNMNRRKISEYLTLELKQAIRDDVLGNFVMMSNGWIAASSSRHRKSPAQSCTFSRIKI
jgi:hypothetical protein